MNTLATIRTANRLFGNLAPKLTAKLARRILMTPHVPRAREWELGVLAEAQPITFRFGLAGLRWGSHGPIVLLVHGWEGRPTQFAQLVAPLRARVMDPQHRLLLDTVRVAIEDAGYGGRPRGWRRSPSASALIRCGPPRPTAPTPPRCAKRPWWSRSWRRCLRHQHGVPDGQSEWPGWWCKTSL